MKTHIAYPPKHLWAQRLRPTSGGCILWLTKSTNQPVQANPRIVHMGVQIEIPRMLWALTHGGATPRLLVKTCDTACCVNPAHHRQGKETCKRGHPRTPDNVNPSNRECKPCRRTKQNSPEQRRRAQQRRKPETQKAAIERYEERQRLARRIRDHIAFWSPSANRWLRNEGHRWITASDPEVTLAIGRYLKENHLAGDPPDLMRRIRRLAKPLEEAA